MPTTKCRKDQLMRQANSAGYDIRARKCYRVLCTCEWGYHFALAGPDIRRNNLTADDVRTIMARREKGSQEKGSQEKGSQEKGSQEKGSQEKGSQETTNDPRTRRNVDKADLKGKSQNG